MPVFVCNGVSSRRRADDGGFAAPLLERIRRLNRSLDRGSIA